MKQFLSLHQLLENPQDSVTVVFISTDENGQKFLGTSGNYLVSVEEAQKTIDACIDYLRHIEPSTIEAYNAKLLELRRERREDNEGRPAIKTARKTQIYLMHHKRSGLYKIGRSHNPSTREQTLQAQEPELELIFSAPGTFETETFLHNTYKEKRVRGEWFSLDAHDLQSIKSYLTNP